MAAESFEVLVVRDGDAAAEDTDVEEEEQEEQAAQGAREEGLQQQQQQQQQPAARKNAEEGAAGGDGDAERTAEDGKGETRTHGKGTAGGGGGEVGSAEEGDRQGRAAEVAGRAVTIQKEDPSGTCLVEPEAFETSLNDAEQFEGDEIDQAEYARANSGLETVTGKHKSVLGMSLHEWRQCRQRRKKGQTAAAAVEAVAKERRQKKELKPKRNKHSYKQRKNVPDEIAAGRRKKKSALHGTGVSEWWAPKNWYYVLLDYNWRFVFFLATFMYLLTCLLWSLVTWALADDIECEAGVTVFVPGTLGSAFVFTTSNILTLGYGPCLPGSYGLYAMACVQQYSGIILNVIVLSVVVSKFQIPKPDVVFSKKALVTTRDGNPVLLIRVGNRRVNLLYETRVSLDVLNFHDTIEGESYVNYSPMNVQFPPTMTAVATIIHRIDHTSPLRKYLLDEGEVDISQIAISVSFMGHDSVYNEMLVCTTQYKGSDLEVGGILFADMMEKMSRGKGIRANFNKFDGIKASQSVTNESLMDTLDAMEWADDVGDDVGGALTVAPSQSVATVASRRRYRANRLINDVTREFVRTELPEEVIETTVYLCYGSIKCKNTMVRACPYSRVIFVYLVETGISHQVIDIDWDNKPEWFLKGNPGGRTPAIIFGGKWVHNSRDIMRFLSKTFPDQAKRINLPHDLPVAPFDFYEAVERFGTQCMFSSPEKMTEMRNMKKDDRRLQCSVMPFRRNSQSDRTGRVQPPGSPSRNAKLRYERIWKSEPPHRSDKLHVLVAVVHRGDRVVRFCPHSQKIEMVLRFLDIPYNAVLIDIDNVPSWHGDGPVSAIYGFGRKLKGSATELIQILADELFPERFAALKKNRPLSDMERFCTDLEKNVKAYLLAEEDPDAERAALDRLESQLRPMEDHLVSTDDSLGWYPFLCGQAGMGFDDLILVPHLHKLLRYNLEAMSDFRLKGHGYPRLCKYLTAMSHTSLFRETTVGDAPASFYTVSMAKALAREVEDASQIPRRCQLTKERLDKEAACIQTIFQEYGKDTISVGPDGSLTVEAGLAGPPLELNTLYLAIGCVKRGDELVKSCPFSRVVEMFAAEANIPHVVLRINLMRKPAWYTAQSNGKCPNMYWNGNWISESQVVLNQIFHLFPTYCQPLGAPAKLDLMSLQDMTQMDLFNKADALTEPYLVAKSNDPERETKRQEMLEMLWAIERRLKENAQRDATWTFVGGAVCSLDDVALCCSVWRLVKVLCGWFHSFNFVREGLVLTKQWLTLMESRQSFKVSIPPEPEAFLCKYYGKFYGDAKDPNNLLTVTALMERNERDALAKIRLLNLNASYAGTDQSMCQLASLECTVGLLEDLLKNGGPYICGTSIGLADILVFGTLKFIEEGLTSLHGFRFADLGLDHVPAYITRLTETLRFRECFSTATAELMRIHMSQRMASSFAWVKLSREEAEHLELAAIAKVSRSTLGRSSRPKDTASQGSNSTLTRTRTSKSSNSLGSGSTNDKGDIEDLLFCI